MVKNWAVIAYTETFARQKKEMAALAAQNLNGQGMMVKSRSENAPHHQPIAATTNDKTETGSVFTLGGME